MEAFLYNSKYCIYVLMYFLPLEIFNNYFIKYHLYPNLYVSSSRTPPRKKCDCILIYFLCLLNTFQVLCLDHSYLNHVSSLIYSVSNIIILLFISMTTFFILKFLKVFIIIIIPLMLLHSDVFGLYSIIFKLNIGFIIFL